MALPASGSIDLVAIQNEFGTSGLAASAVVAGLATLNGTDLVPDTSMRDFLGQNRYVYNLQTLTNSSVYTVPARMTRMTVIVVGGGGAGGGKQDYSRAWDGGGGGGAGGVTAYYNLPVSPGMLYNYYTGAGGTGYAQYGQGNDGGASQFYNDYGSTALNLYAYGGGGGGGSIAYNGRAGGSGGGGASLDGKGVAGSSTSNQGFSGGTGIGDNGYNGGGGGAGGPGNSTRYELTGGLVTSGGRGIGTWLGYTTGNSDWTYTNYLSGFAGGGGAGGGFGTNGQNNRFAAASFGGGDGGYARDYVGSNTSLSNGANGSTNKGGGGGGGGGNVDEYLTYGGNGGSGVIYVLAHNYEGGWSNPWTARGTVLSSYCWPSYGAGFYALFSEYADGFGQSGNGLAEINSATCGYVPYTPPSDGTTG